MPSLSKKEITSTNIGKIKELKEQIISLGTDGQTTAMGYDSDLNEYQPQIETGLPIGQSGQAIGAETIDIGKEILSRYMFWRSALGFKDIAAGTTAANAGSKVQDTSTAISEKNTTNINAVKDHELTIQDVTGVSTADIPQEKQDKEEQKKENIPPRKIDSDIPAESAPIFKGNSTPPKQEAIPLRAKTSGKKQQLGLFKSKANADELIGKVRAKNFDAYAYSETRASGTTYYIVVVDENSSLRMPC